VIKYECVAVICVSRGSSGWRAAAQWLWNFSCLE